MMDREALFYFPGIYIKIKGGTDEETEEDGGGDAYVLIVRHVYSADTGRRADSYDRNRLDEAGDSDAQGADQLT